MERARENLAAARTVLDGDFPGQAVSLAYYAMLYAARAALSERDRYAKTHSVTWQVFQEVFVDTGEFELELLVHARNAQREREGSDYEARRFSQTQGAQAVEFADRFLAAIEQLLGAQPATA